MPSAAREWVAESDADFRSAQRLLRARNDPDFDGAFFHAQQCVEKLMKAVLIRKKTVSPKTHGSLAAGHANCGRSAGPVQPHTLSPSPATSTAAPTRLQICNASDSDSGATWISSQ
jgi:hypothetical protein